VAVEGIAYQLGKSGYGIGSIQIDLVDGVDQQFDKGAYARF